MGRIVKIGLRQGLGAPPQPTVEVGKKVERGEIIAKEITEKLSVPLHASVTGTVTEVNEAYIAIEETKETEDFKRIEKTSTVSEAARAAGIVGMGGAGFPAYVKLNTKLAPGGYLLCNASECEPILSHNMAELTDEPEKIFRGMELAMESTGAEKGILGIKFKHREIIKLLTGYLKEKGIKNIRVLPLRNVYPVGEERALIRDTINILLPPGALPSEANSIVFNTETLSAIADAVDLGKPSIDKYVTVAGRLKGIEKGTVKIKKYPIGTQFEDIIKEFGGRADSEGEILIGGPYTGHRAMANEAISKTSGGMIVTGPFEKVGGNLGIIQCACGPSKDRLNQIADSMGATVVGFQICKNAHEGKGGQYKCENPGHCPGQAEKVLELKKAGASEVLIGHCTDCSNTVMGSAPKLNMKVHHATDHALRTMGMDVIREYKEI